MSRPWSKSGVGSSAASARTTAILLRVARSSSGGSSSGGGDAGLGDRSASSSLMVESAGRTEDRGFGSRIEKVARGMQRGAKTTTCPFLNCLARAETRATRARATRPAARIRPSRWNQSRRRRRATGRGPAGPPIRSRTCWRWRRARGSASADRRPRGGRGALATSPRAPPSFPLARTTRTRRDQRPVRRPDGVPS